MIVIVVQRLTQSSELTLLDEMCYYYYYYCNRFTAPLTLSGTAQVSGTRR